MPDRPWTKAWNRFREQVAISPRSRDMPDFETHRKLTEGTMPSLALGAVTSICLALLFGICLLAILDSTRPLTAKHSVSADTTSAIFAYRMRQPL
jgi:hypothetical protein